MTARAQPSRSNTDFRQYPEFRSMTLSKNILVGDETPCIHTRTFSSLDWGAKAKNQSVSEFVRGKLLATEGA